MLLLVLAGGWLLNGGVVLAIRHAAAQAPPAQPPSQPAQGGGQGQPSPTGRGGFGQGRGPGGQDVRPWWKDPSMAGEVGLTKAQIAKIDRIYEQRQNQIKAKVDEYNRQRDELNRLLRERTAKPSEVEEQARRLSYPRLDIDVSRTRMLYEMSLAMTAEQNTRMRAMFDRLDEERAAAFKRYEQERARGRSGNQPH